MLGTVKCIGSTWFGVSMSGICFYVVSFGNGKGIEGTRGQRGLQYPLVRCLLVRSVELAVLAQRCLMQQVPWILKAHLSASASSLRDATGPFSMLYLYSDVQEVLR